jgi:ATP-dependent RNA helicase RhlB
MNEPEKVIVETETITAARVRQIVYFPSNEEKLPLLIGLLSRTEAYRTMVFVNTKAWVERVGRALERAHYRVGVLSGDVPQKKRQSLLAKFQRGELEILVATDVAARGLHIDNVSHVYNFDLPFEAEDYVHRIGRTARLGAEGDAVSFACEIYAQGLPAIEAYIEQKIPVAAVSSELLTAIPRTPRAKVASADGEPEESIADIFREARAEMAEKDKKHGGSGKSSRPGDRGPRSGSSRSGSSSAGRDARPPRREERPARPAAVTATAAPPVHSPDAAVAVNGQRHDGEGARRPRRRGPRREGGERSASVHAPAASAPMAAAPVGVSKESFFKRLSSRVKFWVAPSKP